MKFADDFYFVHLNWRHAATRWRREHFIQWGRNNTEAEIDQWIAGTKNSLTTKITSRL